VVAARFLLDSNALSEPLRRAPERGFLQRFEQFRNTLAISTTTWHESLYGMKRMPAGRRRDEVEDFLFNVIEPTLEILPYDRESAAWHADERARLEAAGRVVTFADGQIAAVAVRNGLVLVTRNTQDFASYAGLQLVNWMA
jgi:tRNA(fMet)-specific endonuclease VapC